MPILANKVRKQVSAVNVFFKKNDMHVSLNDGREVVLPLDKISWLNWLLIASPPKRTRWSLEPGGFAIYWDELDNGVEVCHLLDIHPLS